MRLDCCVFWSPCSASSVVAAHLASANSTKHNTTFPPSTYNILWVRLGRTSWTILFLVLYKLVKGLLKDLDFQGSAHVSYVESNICWKQMTNTCCNPKTWGGVHCRTHTLCVFMHQTNFLETYEWAEDIFDIGIKNNKCTKKTWWHIQFAKKWYWTTFICMQDCNNWRSFK